MPRVALGYLLTSTTVHKMSTYRFQLSVGTRGQGFQQGLVFRYMPSITKLPPPSLESCSSEATIDRMSGLLKVFTMKSGLSSSDVVTILKDIAEQSEKMSSGLKVEVMVEGTVETCTQIRRLLPMVFENLLRNAIEYAGVEPSVQISVKQVENRLHVLVRDNGPGVSSDVRARLFQRGTTTGQDGRGQGFYLSRKVLELYGGSIELLDEPEQSGCTFSIILQMGPLKV